MKLIRALTHLILPPRETGDQSDSLHVAPLDRFEVPPVPEVGAGLRDDGVGEAEAAADGDEGDREVGGDAPGDVAQVVPHVAVHLKLEVLCSWFRNIFLKTLRKKKDS